ncbi:MAG: type III-A CRISPR-associated RAMP protein Csm4 [Coprothermobacterota bacterium]|nr:type III-A CRISPR-associated RAMP protein Csm4 [Coprothermobacterota bacterium]
MRTFRVRLHLSATFLTPFDADTLFGGICWIIRQHDGEEELTKFLQSYQEEPPLILSNGFPGDLLPRPLLPIEKVAGGSREEALARGEEGKRWRSLRYLPIDAFLSLAAGNAVDPQELWQECQRSACQRPFRTFSILHNQVDRSSGTTSGEGELFEQTEFALDPSIGFISVYVRASSSWEGKLESLFRLLGQTGLGKRKSTGKGSFSVLAVDEETRFETTSKANAFIALSNFIPAPHDPINGSYRLGVKYGKLGEDYASSTNPFKRPLLMLQAGAVFQSEPVRPWYGQLITDVAPSHPQVLHYGMAFAAPALLPSKGTA